MITQEKQDKRRTYLREYAQRWRKKNPDKNAKIQAAYWQRRMGQMVTQNT
jgi:hypothetical protein